MYLGIRYITEDTDVGWIIKEENMVFQELEKFETKTAADSILQFTKNLEHEMANLICLVLGFDVCFTLADYDTGVQKSIRVKYPKICLFPLRIPPI